MCRILSYTDVDDAQGMAFHSCRYGEDALFIKRVRQHQSSTVNGETLSGAGRHNTLKRYRYWHFLAFPDPAKINHIQPCPTRTPSFPN